MKFAELKSVMKHVLFKHLGLLSLSILLTATSLFQLEAAAADAPTPLPKTHVRVPVKPNIHYLDKTSWIHFREVLKSQDHKKDVDRLKDLDVMLNGGATSGGGSDIGKEVAGYIEPIFYAIHSFGRALYSEEELAKIASVENAYEQPSSIRVIVLDLPDSNLDVYFAEKNYQASAMAATWIDGTPTIFVHLQKYQQMLQPLKREGLVHHELMVLAGNETTGKYILSEKYEQFVQSAVSRQVGQNFVCTFSAFSSHQIYPGQNALTFIGANAVTLHFVGSESAVVTLAQDPQTKHAIQVGYVFDSSGDLRIIANETDVEPFPFPGQPLRFLPKRGAESKTLIKDTTVISHSRDRSFEALLTKQYPFEDGTGFLAISCLVAQ